MQSRTRPDEFNPHYEETFDNSHEIYREMRKKFPVAWSNAFGGFWALFKYEDVIRVQEDAETFSVATQNIVPPGPRNAGRRPPLHFDPPEHANYRKPINPLFQNSRMLALAPALTSFADQLIAPMVERGHGDFTQEFAEYFAAQSFGQILNLPLEMMLRVRKIGVRYYRATTAMDRDRMIEASGDLYAAAAEIVAERKKQLLDPKLDLVSALLLAGERGEPISDEMTVASVRQFLSAAQAAPGAVLGSIAVHLARDADLQERLRRNPALLPDAIEEMLRLYSPYRVFARTATRDVEIRGRLIKEGEAVTMIFPSANRDEDIFEDPDTFRLDREPNRHIAFGRGAHRCPAESLGRVELQIGVATLLRHTSSFELAGEVKMADWVEFGPTSTPLKLVRA